MGKHPLPPLNHHPTGNFGLVRLVLCFLRHPTPNRVSNNNQAQTERLADQIAEYVARNPFAADTLSGIQSWWLSKATPNITSSDVDKAVRILLLRGTLVCHLQPDGTRTYSRA